MSRPNIDSRLKIERRKRRSGFIISVFMMFLLLILMSSFILRYVYSNAGNVQITENGVASVYRAVIGETPFVDDSENELTMDDEEYYEDETEVEEDEDQVLFTDGSGIYQGNRIGTPDNPTNSENQDTIN